MTKRNGPQGRTPNWSSLDHAQRGLFPPTSASAEFDALIRSLPDELLMACIRIGRAQEAVRYWALEQGPMLAEAEAHLKAVEAEMSVPIPGVEWTPPT